MKCALVGHGRMGREVEAAARARGHEVVAIVDPGEAGPLSVAGIDALPPGEVELAFEFTAPRAAEANVSALVARGIAVVCGTTGWDTASSALADAIARARVGVVIAPNFSLGMSLYFRIVATAARAVGAARSHEPFLVEAHHRKKLDAPSGTAKRLREILLSEDRGLAEDALPIASVRAGHEPGTHTVGFDGEHDVITLTHRARGRSGLAAGAVIAGEWLLGKTGRHEFEEVVADLVGGGGGGKT